MAFEQWASKIYEESAERPAPTAVSRTERPFSAERWSQAYKDICGVEIPIELVDNLQSYSDKYSAGLREAVSRAKQNAATQLVKFQFDRVGLETEDLDSVITKLDNVMEGGVRLTEEKKRRLAESILKRNVEHNQTKKIHLPIAGGTNFDINEGIETGIVLLNSAQKQPLEQKTIAALRTEMHEIFEKAETRLENQHLDEEFYLKLAVLAQESRKQAIESSIQVRKELTDEMKTRAMSTMVTQMESYPEFITPKGTALLAGIKSFLREGRGRVELSEIDRYQRTIDERDRMIADSLSAFTPTRLSADKLREMRGSVLSGVLQIAIYRSIIKKENIYTVLNDLNTKKLPE